MTRKGSSPPPPPEFQTPTRVPRSKYSNNVSYGESPNTDSEFQPDIVWDASSPSPVMAGRRGRSRPAAAVIGISEIVRRIAPLHGRPEVLEPTLQDWMADSASIPCTPEVQQQPKARKKSARPNPADDLLILAKQFNFNMFQQDEEQAEDMHQQSLELLSEDILEYESGYQEGKEPSPPATEGPSPSPRVPLQDHNMDDDGEDDLELLFDESTQRISGGFSQNGFLGSGETPGRPTPASPTHDVLAGKRLAAPATDDWENDDFLDDSVVIEMTQNPLGLAPPQHCSTQRGSDSRAYPSGGTLGRPGEGLAKNEPAIPKNRRTFKLSENPEFPHPTVVRNQRSPLKRHSQPPDAENRPAVGSSNARATPKADPDVERHTLAAPLTGDRFPDEELDHFFSSEPTSLAAPPARLQYAGSSAGKAPSNHTASNTESSGYGPPGPNGYAVGNQGNPQRYGGGASLKPAAGVKDQFTFKKPPSPGVKVISEGPEKCSMAEIEGKKRQALERRRQRLQSAPHNLRAPP
ncbi:hypothetical protein NHX12_026869 [Muraenolepis orangiensis]|uniref:ETAA1 activator of ATR kinase n=1 Tax=Muraenolepis orangiensis TaxID=630683 RepID=A0A9Q0EHZ8_9TELE|nr:hypothetical protein NHX12_026869 [Muraenolepis orangiensis]